MLFLCCFYDFFWSIIIIIFIIFIIIIIIIIIIITTTTTINKDFLKHKSFRTISHAYQMYQQIWLPNQGDAFYKKTKTIPKCANGLDSHKGVHLKNLLVWISSVSSLYPEEGAWEKHLNSERYNVVRWRHVLLYAFCIYYNF